MLKVLNIFYKFEFNTLSVCISRRKINTLKPNYKKGITFIKMLNTRDVQTKHGLFNEDDHNINILPTNNCPEPKEKSLNDEENQNSLDKNNTETTKNIDENIKLKTNCDKRKADENSSISLKKLKLETSAKLETKTKRPGFSEDRYNETSYYFENGLRKVYPYNFTFTTFTKGRWVGNSILDVFSREFRAHPKEEYERSINNGKLTVNYEKVSTDYILKHNDLLANTVHRHEVPVTNQPIKIVEMDEDILVVNKPASIPVHPCGRYRHNTVVFILAKEFNLKNLRTIHRLDRLTSGILLFGRTTKKARELEIQIRNRKVKKEYVCLVDGDFPDTEIECNEPIEVVSYKIGVCRVSSKGKDCSTKFKKLKYDGKSSILLCQPLTGRMHQIRVHLQYLGFPIVNDPLYNHEVFGPNKGKGGDIGGKTDEELINDLIKIHNAENWLAIDGEPNLLKPAAKSEVSEKNLTEQKVDLNPPQTRNNISLKVSNDENDEILDSDINNKTLVTQTNHNISDLVFDPQKISKDEHCFECTVDFTDPKPKDLIMYLHAWKYEGIGWKYETDLPNWANF